VGRVWPGSEAAANGIAAGDEIIAVNDNVAAEITDASLRDLLTQPPGYPVTVEVRSSEGVPRTVQLRSQRYTRKRPVTSNDALAATSLSVVQPTPAAPR
jgi:S1-C subfamily serine protease